VVSATRRAEIRRSRFQWLEKNILSFSNHWKKINPFFQGLEKRVAENVAAYQEERGYSPKVVVAGDRIYGIGNSQKNADLALELAQDGALVLQLANAFSGINYMTDAQREFIENWEVESCREKQEG